MSKTQRKAANEAQQLLKQKEEILEESIVEEEKLGKRALNIETEIVVVKDGIEKLAKTMQLRQRSDTLLAALSLHHNRCIQIFRTFCSLPPPVPLLKILSVLT